jgi:hypothetical protein
MAAKTSTKRKDADTSLCNRQQRAFVYFIDFKTFFAIVNELRNYPCRASRRISGALRRPPITLAAWDASHVDPSELRSTREPGESSLNVCWVCEHGSKRSNDRAPFQS